MSAIDKFRSLFNKVTTERGDAWLERIPAFIGKKDGTVQTGTFGMIWVRDYSGQPLKVFNNVVEATKDIVVLVGRRKDQPTLWQVVGNRDVWSIPGLSGTMPHHLQHEFMQPDMVMLDRRQTVQLSAIVADASAFTVQIYGAVVPTANGLVLVDNEELDFSSHIPEAGAVYVTIEIGDDGSLSLHDGDVFGSPAMANPIYYPQPDPGKYPQYVVLLYEGLTTLTNDLIKPIITAGALSQNDSAIWGNIDGDISDQTDLRDALRQKAEVDFVPRLQTVTSSHFLTNNVNSISWRGGNVISSVTLNGTQYQVYAYYNSSGYITIAVRQIPRGWAIYTTTIQFVGGGDGHNYITMALDPNGYIHICYDMHNIALKYRKSTLPVDQFAGTLTSEIPMLGTNESSVSYPALFNDPAGNLYFMFRDGIAGDGDLYFYSYDHAAGTWSAATGTGTGGILIQGKPTDNSPYWYMPGFDANFGDDGKMHFAWAWCALTGLLYPNISYVAWDGTAFTKSDGSAQIIPITISNDDNIETLTGSAVQPSVLHQGVYSDDDGHPHLVFSRGDAGSVVNLYYLWHDGSAWVKLLLDTPAVADSSFVQWPCLVIDRKQNIAHVIYTSHGEGDTRIYVLSSGAGDYTTWTKRVLYNGETDIDGSGNYGPKVDIAEWERTKRLVIPIEVYSATPTQPIHVLDYMLLGYSFRDSENFPNLHTNDIDSADGIHHTLGTGATQAAAGDHTHGGGAGGQYRQFVYVVSGGDFSFVIDAGGNPIMALQDLE